MKTRGKDRCRSSVNPQASAKQPKTEVRRSKRKSAATPAGTLDSPDHVLKLQFDSAGPTKHIGNKSKSRISSTHKKAKAPRKQAPEISILTPACLMEIFKLCDQRDRKLDLPLVCKHWRDVLRLPSKAWETLSIDNTSEYNIPRSDDFTFPSLSFAKVLKWIKPRAKGVVDLSFTYNVWKDGTQPYEPSDIAERSFRAILKLVAPTLESLHIDPQYEGFGFPLRWSVLKDIAAAEYLTTLQLYFVDDGNLTASHVEDIKVFKYLDHLALRWAPCYDEEFSSQRSIMEAPSVTNPNGTTSISAEPTVPLNLFDLVYLESLHLESEYLNGPFPKELEKMTLLKDLSLGWQNLPKLEYIPSLLLKLSLRGSNNGQNIINNGLGYFLSRTYPDLRELDLSHCNLKKFECRSDDEVKEETINDVEILNLSYNNLGPLPQIDFLGDMWKLKRLDLSHCGLSVVPDSVVGCLVSLEKLHLNDNNLVDLPQDFIHMRRLQHLNLDRNSFPAIPEVLKKMPSLKVIFVDDCCYLEVAKSMTDWLLEMKNLSKLCMRKGYTGKYHESSIKWLEEAASELTNVGRGDVLEYTRGY